MNNPNIPAASAISAGLSFLLERFPIWPFTLFQKAAFNTKVLVVILLSVAIGIFLFLSNSGGIVTGITLGDVIVLLTNVGSAIVAFAVQHAWVNQVLTRSQLTPDPNTTTKAG